MENFLHTIYNKIYDMQSYDMQIISCSNFYLSKIKMSYIVTIIFTLLLFVYLYIIIKSPFWSRQPVFHIYNIRYLVYDAMIPGKIIKKETQIIPRSFKYENYSNISTTQISSLSTETWSKISIFIAKYYLNNDSFSYSPTVDNIKPYFLNHHKDSAIISFYHKNNDLLGLITSRILTFSIVNYNSLNVYYVDFLCVHDKHRQKGIAPQLIQMHECNQRKHNNLDVSLFKKEGNLHPIIIPLVVFNSYIYDVSKFKKKTIIHSSYSIILISKTNIYLFWDLFQNFKHLFKCTIITSMANLTDLIASQNIFVFCLLHRGKIVAAYLFRTTKTTFKTKKTIELFASLSINIIHKSAFFTAFRDIVVSNFTNFYLIIENISFNSIIQKNISLSYKPITQIPIAYYIYNYVIHSFRPDEILIIS